MKRAALLAIALAVGGCGRVLGIHDSYPLVDGGAGTSGGAGNDGAAGGGAGADAGAADAAIEARPDAAGGDADAAASVDASDAAAAADASDASDASDAAPARICPARPTRTVTALVYASGPHGANNTNLGNCGFPLSILPTQRYYGAVGPELYANAAACGACMLVEELATKKQVEVQIIDSTGANDVISIDAPAHAMLSASGNNPTVKVHLAPCSYQGTTIKAAFKEAGFAAPMLFDHRTVPTKVEIRGQGTTAWTTLTRQSYNNWVPPNGYSPNGTTASLRITDEAGSVVETGNLTIDTTFQDTGKQFPACTVAN